MAEADLATERAALALLDELFDVPESRRASWIADRTSDPKVKARLHAILDADRVSSLRTGAANTVNESAPLPERIGQYRITGLIGRGGMGAVYRGVRDSGDFDHEAAIKLVKPGLLSDILTQRFLAERQTLATLAHPNIARLFDGGSTPEGSPYIIMELIDGIPIDRWAAARSLGQAARLRLLESVADAVAYAHQRLVIHRDITPLNVLVQPDGTPKLIDFGIARPVSDTAEVTTAVDIAGLGRLTARLLPDAPPELAAIIARATAADPAARYATAQAFADDLIAYRGGHPVAAMGGGRRYAVRKFIARHRLAVGSSAAAVVLLVAALVAVLIANAETRRAGREAEARFQQTRAIANAMLFDVFDKVSRVTGATAARTALAKTSVDYLDALAAMQQAPADVRVEAGRGYVRLAEVTGGGQSSQLGRYADAAALLAKAETLLAPAYAANPDVPATAQAFAVMRLEQAGQSLYNSNDTAAAQRQAVDAEKAIAPFASATAEAANSYILAVQTQADSHGWNDEWAPALAQHGRAERFAASLPPALQQDTAVMTARSSNLRLMGEAYHKLQREPEAEATLARAVAINRLLYARAPDDPKILRKLTTSLWYSAVVHRTAERDAKALAAIEEAMELARRLAVRDPGDAGGIQMTAIVGEVLAQVRADAGDRQRSYAASDEVMGAHRRLVALAGNSPGARRSMATALSTRGGNAYNLGDIAAACTSWQEGLGIYTALDASGELSETDRKNGLPEVRGFIADYCKGGKPRRDWPKEM